LTNIGPVNFEKTGVKEIVKTGNNSRTYTGWVKKKAVDFKRIRQKTEKVGRTEIV